jgi:hypothetical protein
MEALPDRQDPLVHVKLFFKHVITLLFYIKLENVHENSAGFTMGLGVLKHKNKNKLSIIIPNKIITKVSISKTKIRINSTL